MPKLSKINKVNLTLLKELVKEFEESLTRADEIKEETDSGYTKYVVEMSKAQGLAAGVMKEASMLILDIHQVTSYNGVSSTSGSTDLVDKIFKSFKGEGGKN